MEFKKHDELSNCDVFELQYYLTCLSDLDICAKGDYPYILNRIRHIVEILEV